MNVINKLESTDYISSIDYAKYKIDWICTLSFTVGGSLEEAVLPSLQEAARMWSIINEDNDDSLMPLPAEIKKKTVSKVGRNLIFPVNS